MCTVSIVRTGQHMLLTMNRDDSPAKAEAGPAMRSLSGSMFAAPTDLAANGTWVGVNSFGVAACLLNRYDPAPAGVVSRGFVVLDVMNAQDLTSGVSRLQALPLHTFSPFTCLVVWRGKIIRLDWTGARANVAVLPDTNAFTATSSSWSQDTVRGDREALFWDCLSGHNSLPDALTAFHCKRVEERDAWAPMMSRATSHTKSVTQVEIDHAGANMRYWRRETAIANGLQGPDDQLRVGRQASAV